MCCYWCACVQEAAGQAPGHDSFDMQQAYILPAPLMDGMVEVFQPGGGGSTSRRRSRPPSIQSKPAAPPVPPPPPPAPIDIFEDAGRYDPAASAAAARPPNASVESVAGGSSYFAGISSVSSAVADVDDQQGEGEDIMGSVRQLLQAQAAQEKAKKRELEVAQMVVEQDKVHRDVIGGGTMDGAERHPRDGGAMSVYDAGSYDLCPESGDFEVSTGR